MKKSKSFLLLWSSMMAFWSAYATELPIFSDGTHCYQLVGYRESGAPIMQQIDVSVTEQQSSPDYAVSLIHDTTFSSWREWMSAIKKHSPALMQHPQRVDHFITILNYIVSSQNHIHAEGIDRDEMVHFLMGWFYQTSGILNEFGLGQFHQMICLLDGFRIYPTKRWKENFLLSFVALSEKEFVCSSWRHVFLSQVVAEAISYVSTLRMEGNLQPLFNSFFQISQKYPDGFSRQDLQKIYQIARNRGIRIDLNWIKRFGVILNSK